MTTLADRIQQRMAALSLTEEGVVEKIKELTGESISQPGFHKIKVGDTKKPRNILAIATALDCDSSWLSTGEGREPTEGVSEPVSPYDAVGIATMQVPLVSWVKAGDFCECIDLFHPDYAEDWYSKPKGSSERTYALRVDGDSMTSPYPGARSYPDGMIIFVDPEQAITTGSRGIFKLPDTNEATFKELVSDNGQLYLKPLNPQYDKIKVTDKVIMCGKVIGSYLEE